MKKIFSIIVFGVTIAFGQIDLPKDMQNNVPPSPEAFAMTKYGDLPINEFTGMVNYSLPLHIFKSGNLQLPISLVYKETGVKVNEVPTKTGISWVLDAGGVVTRIVKDLPDEYGGTGLRIFKTPTEFVNLNTDDGTPGATELASYVWEGNGYDTETDIFNFNFNGYSGSFYLDQNFNPIIINKDSEIIIDNLINLYNEKKIVITTPDGVRYYFGGIDAVEETMHLRTGIYNAITSFYLTTIVHPIKGEIKIEYFNEPLSRAFLGKSESITYLIEDNFPTGGFYPGGATAPSFCNPPNKYPPVQKFSSENSRYINSKSIKKITSIDTNEEINFIYQQFGSFMVLNNIEVKNVKSINFDYYNLIMFSNEISTKRFFLKSVTFDNVASNSNNKEVFSFEYDNFDALPNRGSYSQDEMGYYNGKYNTTLLTDFKIVYNNTPPLIPQIFEGGDRSTDFDFAKKGTLKKIIYPTKGYTTFEYEAIKIKKIENKNYFLTISKGTSEDIEMQQILYSSIPGNNGADTEIANFNPQFDQNVIFKIESNRSLLHTNLAGQFNVKITNISDSIVIYDMNHTFAFTSNNYFQTFNLDLKANKQYKFELSTNSTPYTDPDLNSFAKLSFDIKEYVLGDSPGIRVKNQIDFANDNVISNYKRYYYMSLEDIYKPIYEQPLSSFEFIEKKAYNMIYGKYCLYTPFVPYYAKYVTVFSNAISDSYLEYKNKHHFVVTSFGGENFEKGGIERVYFYEPNKDLGNQEITQNNSNIFILNEQFENNIAKNDFLNSYSNISLLNGILLREYYFNKKNGKFYLQKKKCLNYDYSYEIGYTNFVGKKFYEVQTYPVDIDPGETTTNFYLKLYNLYKFKNQLSSVLTTDYFEDFEMPNISPLDWQEFGVLNSTIENSDLNIKKITSTQNFEYGTLKGLPTVITTNTSDSAIVNKTVNTYVNTASSLPSIPGNQSPIYTSLISQNRVVSPVQVQQYQNAELLSTQRTLFNNWTIGSTTKILPEKIQVSKGSQTLEDKAIIYNYDDNFNAVIMSNADASKTRYVFNSDGLVVAKIENYTGTATNFPVIVGNLSANCDLHTQNPNAFVTVFIYNLVTKKIIQTIDLNCKNNFYEYDDLHRLKLINDHDGNIVKEFDQQFKPQN